MNRNSDLLVYYTYDAQNQLIRVLEGDFRYDFTYDTYGNILSFGYFEANTIWYLQFHFECDKLLISCMTFPPIYFCCGWRTCFNYTIGGFLESKDFDSTASSGVFFTKVTNPCEKSVKNWTQKFLSFFETFSQRNIQAIVSLGLCSAVADTRTE